MNKVSEWKHNVFKCVEKVFFGKEEVVEKLLAALLCRGHALIEDVPGVGKTMVAKALALTIGGEFNQVQCTPDLLPADVLGVSVYNPKTGGFEYKKGPVITNILLVDEINRATPRTQSALLEAMAEGQVSVEGKSRALPEPFFLIATESPVESEGTFPLPEVQKDRFFLSVSIGYPSRESEMQVMAMHQGEGRGIEEISPVSDLDKLREMQQFVLEVEVAAPIRKYILAIIQETRNDDKLLLPVSPRGSLALYKGAQALSAIRGRDYTVPEDVKDIAVPVLRKRMLIKAEYATKGLNEETAIREILERVEVPPLKDAV